MRPVRKIFDALESHQGGRIDDTYSHIETYFCQVSLNATLRFYFTGDTDITAIQLETVTTADFMDVIAHTKPSARNLMDRYTAWEREYESV